MLFGAGQVLGVVGKSESIVEGLYIYNRIKSGDIIYRGDKASAQFCGFVDLTAGGKNDSYSGCKCYER